MASLAPLAPPPGYRVAWDDDRLNPNRGPRSAAGDAQMDRIWTREVPRRLVETAAAGQKVVVSSSSAAPVSAARYVQVAMFGVPANARTTAAKLQRMGLPVRIGKISRGGKAYQLVLAGPFAGTAQVNAALAQVRAAGFADAYARR